MFCQCLRAPGLEGEISQTYVKRNVRIIFQLGDIGAGFWLADCPTPPVPRHSMAQTLEAMLLRSILSPARRLEQAHTVAADRFDKLLNGFPNPTPAALLPGSLFVGGCTDAVHWAGSRRTDTLKGV